MLLVRLVILLSILFTSLVKLKILLFMLLALLLMLFTLSVKLPRLLFMLFTFLVKLPRLSVKFPRLSSILFTLLAKLIRLLSMLFILFFTLSILTTNWLTVFWRALNSALVTPGAAKETTWGGCLLLHIKLWW